MQISNLAERSSMIYSSNVYFVRGDRDAIEDIHTLVDVGSDPSVIEYISGMSTGIGKRANR